VSPSQDEAPEVSPRTRAEWRRWLERNHDRSTGVWVIMAKKGSGIRAVTYEDALLEALCFGWIDSKVQPKDDRRRRQWFSPRKPRSIWSKPNKERVRRLLDEGLMRPAGLAAMERAKANGSWEILDEVEAEVMPDDLAEALRSTPGAESGFAALSPSLRKQVLYWVASARRPQTREKRIRAAVAAAKGDRSLLGG
jgi:uncharacterized protein YdeI (YjbR/CyaY-like superfamily)